jgi:hypothetical protein
MQQPFQLKEGPEYAQSNGYSLALYFTLDRYRFVAQLEWVEVGPIEPEFDPWE